MHRSGVVGRLGHEVRWRHSGIGPAHRARWRIVHVNAEKARAVSRASADLGVSDGLLGLSVLGAGVALGEASDPAELQE